MKRTFSSWKGIQRGQKFKVISNSNSHNYPMNTVLTMSRDGMTSSSMDDACIEMCGNSLNVRDIELCPMCLADIKAERDTILNYRKKELAELEGMIEFCTKYGIDKYDPKMGESFRILEVAKNPLISDFDKITAISQILSQ
jgi:hypothetical protein